MNWPLGLDYIRALMWPTVLVFALCLFRRPLGKLLGRATEISAFGFSIKAERDTQRLAIRRQALPEVVAAAGKAETLSISELGPKQPTLSTTVQSVSPFGISSEMQVFRAWVELEKISRELSVKMGITPRAMVDVRRVAKELSKRKYLSEETAVFIGDLQAMKDDLIESSKVLFLTDSAADSLLTSINEIIGVLGRIKI